MASSGAGSPAWRMPACIVSGCLPTSPFAVPALHGAGGQGPCPCLHPSPEGEPWAGGPVQQALAGRWGVLGWESPLEEWGAWHGGAWLRAPHWGLLCRHAGGWVAGWVRGGCRRPLSQPSYPYNSGKAALSPAAPSWTQAVAGPLCPALDGSRVAHCCSWPSGSTGPSVPCTEDGPMCRMDRCPAPLWHHHRNSLKSVSLVSSYTNLTHHH